MEKKGNGEKEPEVLRELFEQCKEHFFERFSKHFPRGSRASGEAKQPIADFCGIKDHTIQRWLNGGGKPQGEELIRFMCYLDSQGYRVIELERMKPRRRGFFELVGYGVLTGEEAAQQLGYASVSTLYHVLRENTDTLQDKEEKMWELWKQRKEELDRRKMGIGKLFSSAPKVPRRVTPTSITVTLPSKPAGHVRSGLASVYMMEGLVILWDNELSGLDEIALAEFKREHGKTVLRLSKCLSDLTMRLYAVEGPAGGE